MQKRILLTGAFDTKGEEYDFVIKLIEAQGCKPLTMNWGVLGGTDLFPIDIDNAEVARAGGGDINKLQKDRDRRVAMNVMSKGVGVLAERLYKEGKFDGVFGMGRARGTGVVTSAMRALPIGVPKVVVSTVAAGDTSDYAGVKDVNLFPSIVDVAGINLISEKIFREAAGAICGMVKMDYESGDKERPVIAATMFGQTKPCVDRCRETLTAKGYEFLVFHATGIGGKTMEAMVDDGYVNAVMDITTTEWADELYGGIFSAGGNRLEAPGKAGIPHLIVPGCMDMVNFGPRNSVPEKYQDRLLYESKPTVTLMRTNIEENDQIGKVLAEKANASIGKVVFVLPLKGLSRFDSEGGRFWWPEADQAVFDAIKKNVRPDIEVSELDHHINDEAFSQKAVEILLTMMDQK